MAITLTEFKRLLRASVNREGSIRALGRKHGVQPSHICEALKDGREPTPQVAAALGYRKARAMYERVEVSR